jgi:hypothetical protein
MFFGTMRRSLPLLEMLNPGTCASLGAAPHLRLIDLQPPPLVRDRLIEVITRPIAIDQAGVWTPEVASAGKLASNTGRIECQKVPVNGNVLPEPVSRTASNSKRRSRGAHLRLYCRSDAPSRWSSAGLFEGRDIGSLGTPKSREKSSRPSHNGRAATRRRGPGSSGVSPSSLSPQICRQAPIHC